MFPAMRMEHLSNAVILIDKPEGVTSSDTLNMVKRITGLRKAGHSGTLDKFASGLLVVCSGPATKLTRYFLEQEKRYSAGIRLGVVTDTLDPEGDVLERKEVPEMTDEVLDKVMQSFIGKQLQLPPVFSALKMGGKRASDIARAGEAVELKGREVEITHLTLKKDRDDAALLHAEITCSKGTYVRSLARDIGEFLGTGAFLESLRRTWSGGFSVLNAVTIEELKSGLAHRNEKKWILDPLKALEGMGIIRLKPGIERKALNGAPFSREDVESITAGAEGPSLVLDACKKLIAIVEPDFVKWSIRYLNVFSDRE